MVIQFPLFVSFTPRSQAEVYYIESGLFSEMKFLLKSEHDPGKSGVSRDKAVMSWYRRRKAPEKVAVISPDCLKLDTP